MGVGVGLAFSQILLTPDPVRLVDMAGDGLLRGLENAFRLSATALKDQDPAKAKTALDAFSAAHDELMVLKAGIDSARYAARWSLRGRLAAKEVARMADRYDSHAVRLYASCLLFGEALVNGLRRNAGNVPPQLEPQVMSAASLCEALSVSANSTHTPAFEEYRGDVSKEWRNVMIQLQNAMHVLRTLEALTHTGDLEAPVGGADAHLRPRMEKRRPS